MVLQKCSRYASKNDIGTYSFFGGWLFSTIIFPPSLSQTLLPDILPNTVEIRDWGQCQVIKENVEKLNTEIMQPLKKLPTLMFLLSTSQALLVIENFSSNQLCCYQAFLKHVCSIFKEHLIQRCSGWLSV
jgi:hypothetical protein